MVDWRVEVHLKLGVSNVLVIDQGDLDAIGTAPSAVPMYRAELVARGGSRSSG